LSWIDKVLKSDPKSANAYLYQGKTFAKLEKYEEALSSFQKALEIDANPKYVAAASQLLGMITKYVEKKRKGDELAAKDIQKNIQKNVDSASKEAEKEGLMIAGMSSFEKNSDNEEKLNPEEVAKKVKDVAKLIHEDVEKKRKLTWHDRPPSDPMPSPNTARRAHVAYCVKCKKKRDMKNEKQLTMKNGRHVLAGVCAVCGTKMFKVGSYS
jgi:tetratricopeptide (TPR) repeat protein